MLDIGSHEKVVVVIRKHWLPFVLKAVALGIGAVVPFGVLALLPAEITSPFMSLAHANQWAAFSYFFWLLVLWVLLFVTWTNYYLDAWVVTNERIIDIDQIGLFSRKIATARLEKIQDAHVQVDGLVPTLFGYGTLSLYTAGENPDIVIEHAAHPYKAKEKILAAQGRSVAKDTPAAGVV